MEKCMKLSSSVAEKTLCELAVASKVPLELQRPLTYYKIKDLPWFDFKDRNGCARVVPQTMRHELNPAAECNSNDSHLSVILSGDSDGFRILWKLVLTTEVWKRYTGIQGFFFYFLMRLVFAMRIFINFYRPHITLDLCYIVYDRA
ncbi:unnamed protein product [Cercopithifilaria johnstoni]|uniref:Uncharacterized protein n=1 Tax=Cercopithifilaria johnstoni TaxID=2874296 RepID=A0A8J2LYU9_9BILA|nr:unnamed protein product [Cercopithifilaria johnstoni]